ncbi:MAG: hypothetical protein WC004_02665 [Candidatus Absconditabacterales bacterium]
MTYSGKFPYYTESKTGLTKTPDIFKTQEGRFFIGLVGNRGDAPQELLMALESSEPGDHRHTFVGVNEAMDYVTAGIGRPGGKLVEFDDIIQAKEAVAFILEYRKNDTIAQGIKDRKAFIEKILNAQPA